MITASVMLGRAELKVIVWTPAPAMLNEIVSVPASELALMIACRSEPAPLSLVFVTANVFKSACQSAAVSDVSTVEVGNSGRLACTLKHIRGDEHQRQRSRLAA